MLRLLAILLSLVFAYDADAKTARNPETPRQFQRLHPCPSNGSPVGGCPGWQRDHIVPLCAGGPDTVANMQWLTVQDHAWKTRADVRRCRYLRP